MDSATFEQYLADLGWSLWTELGVSGVLRSHSQVVLDLEPLVLATPMLARADARLRLEARRWSAAHGRWLSASRLKALARASSDPRAQEAYAVFASGDGVDAGKKAPTLRMERPALLRLRLRAFIGVGARADVLGQLLADPGRPATASDLSWLGYTKRTVAGILADLEAGGLVIAHRRSNRIAYDLEAPDHLAALVASTELSWVCWRSVFAFLYEVEGLFGIADKPASVRRVAAVKRADAMASLTSRIGLPRPPALAGDPDAWQLLLEWATAQLPSLTAHTASLSAHR